MALRLEEKREKVIDELINLVKTQDFPGVEDKNILEILPVQFKEQEEINIYYKFNKDGIVAFQSQQALACSLWQDVDDARIEVLRLIFLNRLEEEIISWIERDGTAYDDSSGENIDKKIGVYFADLLMKKLEEKGYICIYSNPQGEYFIGKRGVEYIRDEEGVLGYFEKGSKWDS